jgi:hypothetical protein
MRNRIRRLVEAAARCGGPPWLPLATIGIVALIVFHDSLLPDRLFLFRDSAFFYPPIYRLVRNEWLDGRVPLWNPLVNGGQPLAGSGTSGAFYPPQVLLTLLVPEGTSLNAYVVVHLLIAAWGSYAIARSRGCSPQAATVAGLSFGFCGSLLGNAYNPIFAAGAAWLAWGMKAGLDLLAKPSTSSFLLLAVALALAVLCGDPQTAYHLGLVLAATVLFARPVVPEHRLSPMRSLRVFIRLRAAPLALLGAAGLLGGLLALPQIVLAAEFAADSSRSVDPLPLSIWQIPTFLGGGRDLPRDVQWFDALIGRPPPSAKHHETIYFFSLAPWRLLECLWPGLYGLVYERWITHAGLETDRSMWTPSIYSGVSCLLAAVACCSGAVGSGPARYWRGVALGALLMALGGFGAGWAMRQIWGLMEGRWAGVLYRPGDEVGGLYWLATTCLPGYSAFRYPAKWTVFLSLALAQLAGHGVDRLAAGRSVRGTGLVARWLAGGVAGILLLGLLCCCAWGPDGILPGPTAAVRERSFLWVLRGGITGLGVLLCIAALLRVRTTTPTSPLFRSRALDSRGKSLPRLFPGMKTAGFRGCSAPGTSSLTCSSQFIHSLLIIVAADLGLAARPMIAVGRMGDLSRHAAGVDALELRRLDRMRGSGAMRLMAVTEDAPFVIDNPAAYSRFCGESLTSHMPLLHGCHAIRSGGTSMQVDAAMLGCGMRAGDRLIVARQAFDLSAVEWFIVPNVPDSVRDSADLFRNWSDAQNDGHFDGPGPKGDPMPIIPIPPIRSPRPGTDAGSDDADGDGSNRGLPQPDYIAIRNESVVPRIRLVRSPRLHEPFSKDRWKPWLLHLARLAYPTPDTPSPAMATLVENPSDGVLADQIVNLARVQPDAGSARDDKLLLTVDEPQRVVIEATVSEPAILVLADSFHPDWLVRVTTGDNRGEARPALRVNQIHRGVVLGRGGHTVEFFYRSKTFERTWPVCLAAWGGVVLLAGAIGAVSSRSDKTGSDAPASRPSGGRPDAS